MGDTAQQGRAESPENAADPEGRGAHPLLERAWPDGSCRPSLRAPPRGSKGHCHQTRGRRLASRGAERQQPRRPASPERVNQIFSIFAFATCGGYSGKTSILLTCKNNQNITWTRDFFYPFRLSKISFGPLEPGMKCNNTWKMPSYLVGDFSSSAEFFVTFAVLVFLYCIAASILYLGYMHLYRGAGKLPMVDFIFTVIIAFLWLVSTSAWAKALVDIKVSTGPSIVMGQYCTTQANFCHFNDIRRMGSLNVSVVVGFLNLILWAGGAWFVYKETHLHSPPSSASPNATSSPSPSGM